MAEEELYYQTPPIGVFADIKANCFLVWASLENAGNHKYVLGKISALLDVNNVRDNYMFLILKFDCCNQSKLFARLLPSTLRYLEKVYVSVGDYHYARAVTDALREQEGS